MVVTETRRTVEMLIEKYHESENVKKIEFIIAYLYFPIIADRWHLCALFKRVYSAIQLTVFTGYLITTVTTNISDLDRPDRFVQWVVELKTEAVLLRGSLNQLAGIK